MICYLNGDYLPYEKCTVHISDLQMQRGYGVFDYFRCRNGEIPWVNDYTDRFYKSARSSGIGIDISPAEFTSIIAELSGKNGDPDSAFKAIATGGYSEDHASATGPANLLILNLPWKKPAEESFTKGIHLVSHDFIRPNPEIKSLFYFNTLMLRPKMLQYNAADILFHSDKISEASRANVFFIKKGKIYTPKNNILHGITRKQVLERFPEIRIEDIEFSELYSFDEMFLSSTSRDISPVVSVDGKKIGKGIPGPVSMEIMRKFNNY